MIDTALQSAYDRGARADELQPLWKQRNDALRGLILTARPIPSPEFDDPDFDE